MDDELSDKQFDEMKIASKKILEIANVELRNFDKIESCQIIATVLAQYGLEQDVAIEDFKLNSDYMIVFFEMSLIVQRLRDKYKNRKKEEIHDK